jgi:hypothetical protein
MITNNRESCQIETPSQKTNQKKENKMLPIIIAAVEAAIAVGAATAAVAKAAKTIKG